MARAEYLDGSATAIKRVVQDLVLFAQGTDPVRVPDFMFQHREAANFPWVSQAAWLYAQMCAAGHAVADSADYESAQGVFRPDIYRAALRPMGDHEVIYGDVVAYRGDPGVDALGFFRGKFVTLKSGE